MKLFLSLVVALLWAYVDAGKDGRCPPTPEMVKLIAQTIEDIDFSRCTSKNPEERKQMMMYLFAMGLAKQMEWFNEDDSLNREAVLESAKWVTADECMVDKIRSGYDTCFLPSNCSETETNVTDVVMCCFIQQHVLCAKDMKEEKKACEIAPEYAGKIIKLGNDVKAVLDDVGVSKSEGTYAEGDEIVAMCPLVIKYFHEENCIVGDTFSKEHTKEFFEKAFDFADEVTVLRINEEIETCFEKVSGIPEGDESSNNASTNATINGRNCANSFCLLDIYKKVCEGNS